MLLSGVLLLHVIKLVHNIMQNLVFYLKKIRVPYNDKLGYNPKLDI